MSELSDVLNVLVLAGFVPAVLIICKGIWHEDRWIAFEQKVRRKIKQVFGIGKRLSHE